MTSPRDQPTREFEVRAKDAEPPKGDPSLGPETRELAGRPAVPEPDLTPEGTETRALPQGRSTSGASRRPLASAPSSPGNAPPTTVVEELPEDLHALRDIDGLPVPEPNEYLPIAGEDVLFQGDFIGRYSVLSRLGRGGMGVVYKAYDPQLDRNVALKVMRPGGAIDPTTKELRLLREAQTLAKLRHGNIVAVYDAGLSPQGVFVAMELVEGQTLGAWLDEEVRPVREILHKFRDAGCGLAAAHDAGIVHRDFKPANVLIGDDGVARVLDFGLARLVDAGPTHEVKDHDALLKLATSSRVPGSTTASGVLMGTPAYMAPEQLSGKRVDERSDQYTFCLCLQLALGGEMPDRGADLDHIIARIPNPPRRSAEGTTPSRVRRALERGLSIDPAARFESMEQLLAELDEPPRRWTTVAAFSMVGVSFALGAVLFGDPPPQDPAPCRDAQAHLMDTWGDDDRRAVREAFSGSGYDRAPALLFRVETELDEYARAWVEMYDRSCRATHVDQSQSIEKFDRQVFCLERRRSRLRAAVDALAKVDSAHAAVERTVLPFRLPMLEACDDPEALAAQKPLPEDTRLRQQVETLRRRLDYAQILDQGGESQEAIETARLVLEEARETSYRPVLAEALGVLGALQASGTSVRDAERTLKEAIATAASAEADAVAASAWTWLIHAMMYQGRFDEGFSLQFAAEAAVERANDKVIRGWLLNNLGALYGGADRAGESIEYLKRALALKQSTLGEDHFDVAISWHNLGNLQAIEGRRDEALDAFVAAREGFERTVGESHPMTHHAISGMCRVERERGNIARAMELCDEMLVHLEQTPWSTVSVGQMYFEAAKTQWAAGQSSRALQTIERAKALVVDDSPRRAETIDRWLDEHTLASTTTGIPDDPPVSP